MASKIRLALIGCGLMARHHVRTELLHHRDDTEITVVCDPSEAAYEEMAVIFAEHGLPPPPNEPDLDRLLAAYPLDAVFIISPHVYHHDQTVASLRAGVDVLLEKPMVMTAEEAQSLIAWRERTGRLLVVAFPGSLSPQIRKAVQMLRGGELGEVLSISATVWQNWGPVTAGTWRQQRAISGGGFLFDTGAHMLNTIADLVGEDFVEVIAWMDNHHRAVDTLATVMARTAGGVLVTLHACGETIPSCTSNVYVFGTEGILRTDVWGRFLELQRAGEKEFAAVEVPPSRGVWEQFKLVRRGVLQNPCPPEVGLRMARLYDAICSSAEQGGASVRPGPAGV
ncbi:MAG: gfo/Idh/MocA family oxidoreductase [Caldilineae bacterium]|nr:MAG: gfo/Idh/MocA family oxidoreductase [Caldilineae bacterium]